MLILFGENLKYLPTFIRFLIETNLGKLLVTGFV